MIPTTTIRALNVASNDAGEEIARRVEEKVAFTEKGHYGEILSSFWSTEKAGSYMVWSVDLGLPRAMCGHITLYDGR